MAITTSAYGERRRGQVMKLEIVGRLYHSVLMMLQDIPPKSKRDVQYVRQIKGEVVQGYPHFPHPAQIPKSTLTPHRSLPP